MGPEIFSSTGAGVGRKAPIALPDSSSALDRFQSAICSQLTNHHHNSELHGTPLSIAMSILINILPEWPHAAESSITVEEAVGLSPNYSTTLLCG